MSVPILDRCPTCESVGHCCSQCCDACPDFDPCAVVGDAEQHANARDAHPIANSGAYRALTDGVSFPDGIIFIDPNAVPDANHSTNS